MHIDFTIFMFSVHLTCCAVKATLLLTCFCLMCSSWLPFFSLCVWIESFHFSCWQ